MPDALPLKLLDHLEERETELLTWGFLDGGFTWNELAEAAQEILDAADRLDDPAELIQALLDRRLVLSLSIDGRRIFRTRFAEAVRLLARLRQIFRQDQWMAAPGLVSDFRLSVRPRRYPARSITPAAALAQVEEIRHLTAIERAAFHALTHAGAGNESLLSRFQVDSARELLRQRTGPGHGTMISAGTGTGKTLAFYLPCLMKVAGLMRPNVLWTQAIAIYPRNELLKDQFTEAYLQARRLDDVAQRACGRKVQIGAYFGPTPFDASAAYLQQHKWRETARGFVCPFLHCPRCEGELVWTRQDVEAKREQLVCAHGCGGEIRLGEVALTRKGIEQSRPEILFTTTEMLNRYLSCSKTRAVFGVDLPRDRSPYLVLLDEVHTYGGVHGAQVSMLLRRWKHALRHPVEFVGLSATLTDPEGFFGQLVGLSSYQVTTVMPHGDLVEEGKEYQLVLRGDPVSGTSLLSTTIQAAMLLGRVMDPLERGTSEGVFGKKVFVFTDDLDVTNRLFHNLLDAEGRRSDGSHDSTRVPLASLRSSTQSQAAERLRSGQSWELCEQIGHRLDAPPERLEVGRCSSQDTGVDSRSQVIVATASLEVGFNDPDVGTVIQHKAPRDWASFLQRRGRAGRQRQMRPWTVVVLSDYGRDRLAYQAYDQLFDPVLERPVLPTGNRYILRIQATYAFFDWIATQYPGGGHSWRDFTGPSTFPGVRQRQEWAAQRIRSLLETPADREPLVRHLEGALQLSRDEVLALLWEPPRGLLSAALPTLWRRLLTDWRRVKSTPEEPESDHRARHAPLPDFVPENLFSDLNVPEVLISTAGRPGEEPDEWSLPLVQAMATLPPGRVSRRFGVHHITAAHWIPLPRLSPGSQDLPVEQYCVRYEEVAQVQAQVDGQVLQLRCVRPWAIDAVRVPAQVAPTSNARLDWHSQIFPAIASSPTDVPRSSPFSDLVHEVVFYTHHAHCPVRVRRFALGSHAQVTLTNGGEVAAYVRFTEAGTGRPAAVGFEHEVDGIRFQCRISREMLERASRGSCLRSCRIAYFRSRVTTDDALLDASHQNTFRLDWLSQVYLSMLLARAMVDHLTLPLATEYLRIHNWAPEIQHTLDAIFQVVPVQNLDSEDDAEDASAAEPAVSGRTHSALRELLSDQRVQNRLLDLSALLWEEADRDWDCWLTERIKVTIGGALLQACYQIAPQVQAGDLNLDIDPGLPPRGGDPHPEGMHTIWITESMIGGAGVVEEILRRYAEDPRRFFLLAEIALGPSDFELVDTELTRIVDLATSDASVMESFTRIRSAETNQQLNEARLAMMEALRIRDVLLTHPVVTALSARVLRPGSSSQSDALIHRLLHEWTAEEERLHVEIDPRIFAYLASVRSDLQQAARAILQDIGEGPVADTGRLYGIIYGLLWPRGSLVRERALETYNRFADLPRGDPLLLLQEVRLGQSEVAVDEENWRRRVDRALAAEGVVRLSASTTHGELLRQRMLQLLVEPVDVGFLRLFPYAARVERLPQKTVVTFHLREAIQ